MGPPCVPAKRYYKRGANDSEPVPGALSQKGDESWARWATPDILKACPLTTGFLMVFNSIHFLVFFPLVTLGYFLLPHRFRWAWLLAASCYFYASLIPEYLLILFLLVAIDYAAGLMIATAKGTRRRWILTLSIVANVGLLFVFKYFDFFSVNVARLAGALHWNYSPFLLELVLPLGISFHTFQSMAYTIDVYHRRVKPERHFGYYALYVLFYPQLVAGPIERPGHLLPQLDRPHPFDEALATSGLRLMLWGFLKKVAIADSLAVFVNPIFSDIPKHQGLPLIIAAIAFSFQIYCDFSGYTDIARGAARVMGIRLCHNFNQPYLATSISDFWRRWHISLSSWFRDYVYLPLGGSRVGLARHCANLLAVFLLSGFWHGASWTFVAWGALHGLYLTSSVLWKRVFPGSEQEVSTMGRSGRVALTFTLVTFAWIFFRADSMSDALTFVTHLGFSTPEGWSWQLRPRAIAIAGLVVFMMTAEWWWNRSESSEIRFSSAPPWFRWCAYAAIALMVLNLGVAEDIPFIYFQF